MGKRLLIDVDAKTDTNNVYLPETVSSGGSVATGGSITIDSLSIPQDTRATYTLDLTTITDFSQFTADNAELFVTDYLGTNLFPSPPTAQTFQPSNTTEIITQLKDLIEAQEGQLYTYGTWVLSSVNTNIEYNLDDVAQTLSFRHKTVGDEYNFIPITVQIKYSTDPDVTLGSGELTGGASAFPTPRTIQLDLDTTTVTTITEGTNFNSTDDVDTVINALATAINNETDFTPNGVSYNSSTNVLSFDTTTNTSSYNNSLPAIVDNVIPRKAEANFEVEAGSPSSAGTIDFQIGSKTLSVTIDGTEANETEVLTKIETAMSTDATWDYEIDVANTRIASKQIGSEFNGTMYVVTDTGLTFEINGNVGQNDTTFLFITGRSDIVTTSSPVAMTGGQAVVTGLTGQLATIAKRRKMFIGSGQINLQGFGGYILVKEFPDSFTTQNQVLSIQNNVTQISTGNGIGFQDKFIRFNNNNPYYTVLFKVKEDGVGNRSISNTPEDHIVFKIWKSVGGYLNMSRVYFADPFKTVLNGWEFTTTEDTILTDADLFTVPENRFLVVTFPEKGAGSLSISINTDNGSGNIGSSVHTKLVTDAVIDQLDTDLDNNIFVRGILANDNTDIILDVIKTEGD